ncbi:MAG TPA: hypothetical protein VG407_01195 [Caulobacteraceae bacterium]|jgi:hypothetical protein|nr:hypothetical protein [Caulobacteraceae bacterium]
MAWSNQKTVLAAGAGIALVIGVGLAVLFVARTPKPSGPPPASQGGLQISVNNTPPANSNKKLLCYVNDAPVGELSLADCARQNGVLEGALDVGLDDNGNLAAAPTASLAPPPTLPPAVALPPVAQPSAPGAIPAEPRQAASQASPLPAQARAGSGGGACLRFSNGEWRQVSGSMGLNDCVQALFAGRCLHPGEADYGRYGDTTLRLVPGRVEQAYDNAHFHTVVEQRRGTCEIPSAH